MSLTFRPVFRAAFLDAWDRTVKGDAFAGKFLSKCDAIDRWDCCVGAFKGRELVGATVLTVSRRSPAVANLQLIHTFSKHRRNGYGRLMLEETIARASRLASYYRVSSEPDAVAFYRAAGLRFWGTQKSGCMLCMFRFVVGEAVYDERDKAIRDALNKSGRGGVVRLFDSGAT
jgi:GNAT superfamily N-acetyltransferase